MLHQRSGICGCGFHQRPHRWTQLRPKWALGVSLPRGISIPGCLYAPALKSLVRYQSEFSAVPLRPLVNAHIGPRRCTLACNMKPDRLLLAFLVPQMALVSTAVAGQKAVPDDAIHDYIAAEIAQQIPGIAVDVTNGVVTLTGNVRTKGQKAQAAKIAKNAPGVKSVMNLITVANP